MATYCNGNLLQKVSTGSEGYYSFDADLLTNYQLLVDTSGSPFTVLCPVYGILNDTLTISDSLHSSRNFALVCKPGFDLEVRSTVGVAHPARYTNLDIFAGDGANFFGTHCANGISGTVTIIVNGPLTVTGASNSGTTPSSVNGDTLVWNIADFGTLLSPYFYITILTDTFAPMGAPVCVTTIINSVVGDYNLANNMGSFCFPVTSSYDPNIKEVYPAANIDTAQKELTYTIHFQNTGTAQAFHIYVDDTLDTDVDASTFQLLAYSHQPVVQLKGNAVRFNFPNINLPDSNTNEPLSHGYVQYKIKLKDNLPIGTTINNTAYIYFDFNAPVVTNTTTNTIATNTGIQTFSNQHSTFRIYPNPASNSVNIAITEDLLNSTLTLTDITGRQLAVTQLSINNYELIIDGFANGVYFATIRKDGGVYSKKLMIQH